MVDKSFPAAKLVIDSEILYFVLYRFAIVQVKSRNVVCFDKSRAFVNIFLRSFLKETFALIKLGFQRRAISKIKNIGLTSAVQLETWSVELACNPKGI